MSAKRGAKSKGTGSDLKGKFETIIENLSDVLVEIDSDMKISYVSPQVTELTGFKPEELIGREIAESIHPDDLEIIFQKIGEALEGERVIRFRFRTKHKDGHYIPVLSSGRMVEDGDDYMMIGVLSDFTKQALLEESLQKSEEMWRSITETTPDIVMVVDINGTILYINRVVSGLDKKDVIGKSHYDFILPEYHEIVRKALKKVFKSGKSAHYIIQGTGPDGSISYYETTVGPLLEGDQIESLVLFIRDITKPKEMKEALQKSEAKYRSIVENVNDVLYIHDFKGNIIDTNTNACKMLDYEFSELVGQNLEFIACEEERKLIKPRMQNLIKKGRLIFEGEHITKKGKHIPVSISTRVVSNEGKGVVQSFVRDISELKNIEKELKESEVKYSTLVESSKDGIAIVQDGFVKYANKAIFELTGQNSDELIDSEFNEIISPKHREKIYEYYLDRLKGKEVPSVYELEILRKDGSGVPIEVNNSLINFEGKPATLSFVRDLTDRKETLSALSESEERYRRTIESLASVIYSFTPNYKVNFVSDNIRNFGYNSKNFYEDDQLWLKMMHPDDRIVQEEKFTKFYNGKHVRLEREYRIVKGKKQHWIHDELVKTYDSDGNIEMFYGSLIEITKSKEAEEALKESELKYRNLFEYSPESIILISLEGVVLDCNAVASSITGVEKEEMIGHSVFDLEVLFEEDIGTLQVVLSHIAQGENIGPHEIRLKGEKGPTWVEVFLTLLKRESGEVYAIQAISRNITERKKAEMEMRKKLLKFDLENGNIYLVKESNLIQSLEVFKELLDVGFPGIIISRKPRKSFEKGIEHLFEHLWLSEMSSGTSISPKPSKIAKHIDSYQNESAFLIDGFDYLVTKVGFDESLNLIQSLNELVYLKNHVLILPVDPSTLKENELRLLERETNQLFSQESLGKMDGKLIDILRYLEKENKLGNTPSYSDVGNALELSKPTARKRIRQLVKNECLTEIVKGRNKCVRITNKGETYMVF